MNEITFPKTYVVFRSNKPIVIDGKDNDLSWEGVDFTTSFLDIEGVKTPSQSTKVKMLWDDDFLYIYALLKEKHVWGNLKKRDTVIFFNNDFEVFISPSNTTHNYAEIEVNALNTVWDLKLDKPYNVNGKADNNWDLQNLKTAVFVKGTLNNSTDIDDFWSVEMAIPLVDLAFLKVKNKKVPIDKEQWRINFSRVEWDFDLKNNHYSRKKVANSFLPEYNWVWSNQKVINMHLPEHWGYIQFSKNLPSKRILFKHQTDVLTEQISYAIFREIKTKKHELLLKKPINTIVNFKPFTIKKQQIMSTFLKTEKGFMLTIINKTKNISYQINQDKLILRNSNNN